MTRVSVVMPSLNSADYIARAIESVLSQPCDSLELVIQDGGSTDRTADVIAGFDDERISLVSEPDDGQSQALNRAIARARGDWVLWLNADDELAPGGLASLAQAADGSDVVYGDFAIVNEGGAVVKEYETPLFSFDRFVRRGAYIFSGAMLVRRDVFGRFGAFDEHLSYCMDMDFLCRIGRGVRARYSPGVVAYLRYHSESKSVTRPWSFWREQWVVARRYDPNAVAVAARQAQTAAYVLTRPLWRSRLWRQLRPRKTL
jgi:glycosyltransferase involved in cell wall biosynthesis